VTSEAREEVGSVARFAPAGGEHEIEGTVAHAAAAAPAAAPATGFAPAAAGGTGRGWPVPLVQLPPGLLYRAARSRRGAGGLDGGLRARAATG
jgi:hypothetical protein